MLSEASIPCKADRIASRTIDGQALIVVIDDRALHSLNGVGTRVWQLMDGRTVGEIADALVQQYEVEREQAIGDVLKLVDKLIRLGAVKVQGDS